MAQLDIAGLKAQNDSLLPDNILQEIEPADHRSVNSDGFDSQLNNTELGQQTIYGPVDFLGALTKNSNGVMSPENVIIVNSLADFPTPVLDVIELDPGYKVTYWIASTTIDIGINTFAATGGNTISFFGMHAQGSIITSDSTDAMFNITGSSLDMEKVALYCANGSYFDGDGTGGFFLVLSRVIMVTAQSGGVLSNFATYSFNRCVCLGYAVNGFTFSGTSSQFLINNSTAGTQGGFLGYAGTMFDLTTAVFDSISITGGNRIFMGDGTIFLDGAAAGANLSVRGAAELEGTLFINEDLATTGVSVATITSQDDKWVFAGNTFADGLRNTMTAADTFLTASRTVTIAVAGTYVAVNGTDWTSDVLDNFTSDNEGTLTYVGPGHDLMITAVATVSKSGGGSDKICGKLAIDTGGGFAVSDKTISCTDNTTPAAVTCQGLFSFNSGDKVQLWVANEDSTSDVIVSEANLITKI